MINRASIIFKNKKTNTNYKNNIIRTYTSNKDPKDPLFKWIIFFFGMGFYTQFLNHKKH